jgi:hypothetical protein
VFGVRLEDSGDRRDVVGECRTVAAVGRVGVTGRRGDGEQLGPDALVDVAVEVDGREVVLRLGDGRREVDGGHVFLSVDSTFEPTPTIVNGGNPGRC